MGLKFVNERSIVVDCHDAWRKGMYWTLVNNGTMERVDCKSGCEAVERLKDTCIEVQQYLDELGKAGEQEKDDGYKTRACFVSIDDAPALLNLLDASDHVSEWNARRNDMLCSGERCIIRIDYRSDRQLLFQVDGNVVFRDEEPANPSN